MRTPPRRASDRANRRAADRREAETPARLAGGGASLEGRLENVSATGLAFLTPTVEPQIAVGTQVVVVATGHGEGGADREYRGRIVRTETQFGVTGEVRMYALTFGETGQG